MAMARSKIYMIQPKNLLEDFKKYLKY